jgi:tRNA(His) 5'-end guanylyltransferase
MQQTMKYMCENIQGCILGYCESDEITFILIDYQTLDTQPFFDNEVQKICSISASMATMAFNQNFIKIAMDYIYKYEDPFIDIDANTEHYLAALNNALNKGAMFDARCFNIPKEEVTNLIYWRQLDASRNSIQMVGQTNFSHKELQGKSCNDIQDMLMTQKGINWNDFPTYQKRGSCCVKNKKYFKDGDAIGYTLRKPDDTSNWIIDTDIPIFKGEGRQYIEELVDL